MVTKVCEITGISLLLAVSIPSVALYEKHGANKLTDWSVYIGEDDVNRLRNTELSCGVRYI